MKKTAVEWLEWQLGAYIKGNIDELTLDDYYFLIGIAKEMEKEQIIKACNDTIKSVELDSDKTGFIAQTGEGYYNETYKK
jgi:hypothetical protein